MTQILLDSELKPGGRKAGCLWRRMVVKPYPSCKCSQRLSFIGSRFLCRLFVSPIPAGLSFLTHLAALPRHLASVGSAGWTCDPSHVVLSCRPARCSSGKSKKMSRFTEGNGPCHTHGATACLVSNWLKSKTSLKIFTDFREAPLYRNSLFS